MFACGEFDHLGFGVSGNGSDSHSEVSDHPELETARLRRAQNPFPTNSFHEGRNG